MKKQNPILYALSRLKAVSCLVLLMAIALPQSLLAKGITLSVDSASVRDAIEMLHGVEDRSIVVKSSGIDMNRKVSFALYEASIEELLDAIFEGQEISYVINDKSITVTKKVAASAPSTAASVEKRSDIVGVVLDADAQPMIGATVVVEGTNIGTVTNYNGEFSLKCDRFPSELIVSLLGYKNASVIINSYDAITVTLEEDVTIIDDVVVVGYGRQKRVNVTGAVGTISGEDLKNRSVTNAAAAIQGADPSLFVSLGNGSIESDEVSMSIRGTLSLNGGSPLVVIDGVEGSITQVNPNDIESISVLKDASACAIYGAKASAGVVLVTTHSGKSGELKVNYNGRYGVSTNTTTTDFITTGYDYVTLTNEFTEVYKGYAGWNYTDEQMEMLYERRNDTTENADRPWVVTDDDGKYVYLGNFDWYDYMFKKVRPESEHNISMTGGNDRVNFYVGGRYLYREGIFDSASEDIYKGYSFRAKLNAEVTDWLHYSTNISYEKSDYSYGGYWEQDGSTGNVSDGILYSITNNISPTFVPVNPDGTTFIYSNGIQFGNSPIASGRGGVFTDGRNNNSRDKSTLVFTNKFVVDLTGNKDLKFIGDYTYRRSDELEAYRSYPTANTWNASQTEVVDFTNGSIYDFYQEGRKYEDSQSLNAYFDYGHSWGDHTFSAVAGGNLEDVRYSKLTVRQSGSLSDNLSFINMAQGDIESCYETNSAYRTLGFFARGNYDYQSKYLLEFSGRYDGSSRFASEHRWGFFPSLSAGWRISEENFWTPMESVLNEAKIRASYGSLGNQQVSNYYYIDTISTSSMSYTFDGVGTSNYASASSPVSSSLTWETVITYNLGFDLGFLNNRLNVTTDLYIRDTKDMLTSSITLPDVYGASSPKENCADLRTKGYEISVDWRDQFKVAGKPFKYSVGASLGDNTTIITKYNNDDKLLSDYYVGQTLGEIWGYSIEGLFKTDEEASQYQAQYNDTAVNYRVYSCANDNYLMAGDVRFSDLNGDNVVDSGSGTVDDPGDMTVIGNSTPRYTYSFRGSFEWNNFDFSIFFQGVGKIDWMPDSSCSYFWGPYSFPTTSFIPEGFEDMCWSEDNRNTYFPRRRSYQTYSSGSLGVASDRYLQNAAYLRLKSISLGYNIPLKTTAIRGLRVYFTGENLAYWSPLKKYTTTVDPEIATTSASSDCMYPYSKVFSAGIDVTF
ncbi:MAG: TonB-dependent receptor [Rikenellaceae bacterium]